MARPIARAVAQQDHICCFLETAARLEVRAPRRPVRLLAVSVQLAEQDHSNVELFRQASKAVRKVPERFRG